MDGSRISVVRGGGLGDFILGLPLVDSLLATDPLATITVVGPRSWLPLAWRPNRAVPLIALDDPVISMMFAGVPPTPRVGNDPRLSGVGQRERYQQGSEGPQVPPDRVLPADIGIPRNAETVLLLFLTRDDSFDMAWRRTGARTVVWHPSVPRTGSIHATDALLTVLDQLGLPASVTTPRLYLRFEEDAEAIAWLRANEPLGSGPLVAVHAGSGGSWKCWQAERFGQVVATLRTQLDIRLLLISGPADASVTASIARAAGTTAALANSVPLRLLAALLARCDLYLGNDSGVTHLAAAAGCPTIALFGPTDDRVWRPRGRAVHVLRGVYPEALAPDVPTAWKERPLEAELTVHRVLEAAEVLLAAGRGASAASGSDNASPTPWGQ